jgi:hypothetical protein
MMRASMGDQPPQAAPLYHFTVATARGPAQEDIANLLRRVADTLDQLGALDVHDITFHVDWTEEGSWPSMTVYYELDEEAVEDDDDITVLVDDERDADIRFDGSDDAEAGVSLSENVFAVEQKHTPFVGRGTRPREGGAFDLAAEEADEDEGYEGYEGYDDAGEPFHVELPTAHTSERYGPVPSPVVPIVERVPVVRPGASSNEGVATPAPARPAPVQPVDSFPVRTPPGAEKPALERLKGLLRTTNRRRHGPLT